MRGEAEAYPAAAPRSGMRHRVQRFDVWWWEGPSVAANLRVPVRYNASITSAPINTVNRLAEGVWIVDGPVIRFGWPWLKFRFSTLMTVVRLR
jgi:hypothetical protein